MCYFTWYLLILYFAYSRQQIEWQMAVLNVAKHWSQDC